MFPFSCQTHDFNVIEMRIQSARNWTALLCLSSRATFPLCTPSYRFLSPLSVFLQVDTYLGLHKGILTRITGAINPVTSAGNTMESCDLSLTRDVMFEISQKCFSDDGWHWPKSLTVGVEIGIWQRLAERKESTLDLKPPLQPWHHTFNTPTYRIRFHL